MSVLILATPLILYAYLAFSLQITAKKTNTPNGWFAWIPILQLYLSIKIARKPGWWLILYFIPFINFIIYVIIWMKIAEMRNKPGWLGILMIIPPAILIIPGYLAFSR